MQKRFDDALRFTAVINPVELTGHEETWGAFRQGLSFRMNEYRRLWPNLAWVDGAELAASHYFVSFEGRVAGALRHCPYINHPRYGTSPAYLRMIQLQPPAQRAMLADWFNGFLARPDLNKFCDCGHLIVGKEFRATKLGVRLRVRDAAMAYGAFVSQQLGFTKMIALTHEEVNTITYTAPLGFKLVEGLPLLTHPNGTTSRFIVMEELDAEYAAMLMDHADYFENKGQVHVEKVLTGFRQRSVILQTAQEEAEHGNNI